MIRLTESELQIFRGHSSKGNQLKWNIDGTWHKADYTGYEGLAEYVISHLISKSNLAPSEYLLYETEKIEYKHSCYNGAKSKHFLAKGSQLITLQRLYELKRNRDFTNDIWHITDTYNRLKYLIDQVFQMTNLENFGIYITKMLTIDALFLNEDRHLHNVAVIMNPDNTFDYCPFFDHGAGLLADTTIDYPMGIDIYKLISSSKAKTICRSFNEALEVSEKMYCQAVHFSFTQKDVSLLMERDKAYDNETKKRVETIIYEQMRKYPYLFK